MGIKGSNEVSEGLSAVYQFEHSINTSTADQTAGRLSYVGLSGGFGTLTVGQVWGAAYNNSGGLRDINNYYGGSDVTGGGRVGSAVSYAFSSGPAGFQVDAIMDSAKDTGDTVDQLGFGMTISLGDFGKLGLAYENVEDSMMDAMMTGTPSMFAGEAVLKATEDKLDYSGLVVKDKTSRKAIDGTVASIASTLTINDGLLEGQTMMVSLMQVYSKAGATNIPDSFDEVTKHTDGKFYASDCVSATGLDKDCTTKTWAYVGTENDDAAKKGVKSTHTVYVPEQNDLATFEDEKITTAATTKDKMVKVVSYQEDNRANQEVGTTDLPVLVVSDASWNTLVGKTVTVHTYTPNNATSTTEADESKTPVTVYASVTTTDGTSTTTYYIENPTTGAITAIPDTEVKAGTIALAKANNALLADYKTSTTVPDTHTIVSLTAKQVSDTSEESDSYVISHEVTVKTKDMTYGHTSKHVSAQFNLGVLTLGLGFTETENNDPMKPMDSKTTYLGASGSIGDTGMSWVAQARNKEAYNAAGKFVESSPWTVGIGKSLGDGARMFVEHQNSDDGNGGSSVIGLRADF